MTTLTISAIILFVLVSIIKTAIVSNTENKKVHGFARTMQMGSLMVVIASVFVING